MADISRAIPTRSKSVVIFNRGGDEPTRGNMPISLSYSQDKTKHISQILAHLTISSYRVSVVSTNVKSEP